jgi:hypothetical protein
VIYMIFPPVPVFHVAGYVLWITVCCPPQERLGSPSTSISPTRRAHAWGSSDSAADNAEPIPPRPRSRQASTANQVMPTHLVSEWDESVSDRQMD